VDVEQLPLTPERLLSFAPWKEKAAQSSGACRGGDSFDYNPQNINPNQSTCCRPFGNGRNNIQEFQFWQEKNAKELGEVKRFSMTRGSVESPEKLGER
jgi:hypothetical protein